MKKIPIDLIIFDLDGTLTDSIPSAALAIQDMLRELGLPYKSREEINASVGWGEHVLITGTINSDDPALVKKATESYYKHYKENRINEVVLFPHVKETLEYFKEKTIMIISNKKQEFIEIILKNFNLSQYFHKIIGGDNGYCLKPVPCEIIKMLNKLNISKDHALIVGDMAIDVQTGKNAGIHTCAVTYGFDPKEKLENEKPDFLIDTLSDLKNVII